MLRNKVMKKKMKLIKQLIRSTKNFKLIQKKKNKEQEFYCYY